MEFVLIIIGLFLLIKCADWFVDGCSNIASSFGVPSLIIGLTIVAFGTSSPEAAVSVTASFKGMNDIALGNVVGSNICNLFYCTKFIDLRLKIKLELKKHIKPIFTFFGMTLATSIYTMLDTTMLGFLSTNTEVGYYSAATKISHMVLSLITAITTVLLPRMSLYINKNDMNSFKTLTNKTVSIITLLSIPITAGLFLLAKLSASNSNLLYS